LNKSNFTHTLLPEAAQRVLKKAALTPITPFDPLARRKAVDYAINRVRRDFPKYFQKDDI
tara:strand:+ start:579 stop:758 length:180 start_codon:yes stop_codon:yes gene_type:complete